MIKLKLNESEILDDCPQYQQMNISAPQLTVKKTTNQLPYLKNGAEKDFIITFRIGKELFVLPTLYNVI